jgi:hypothetical protein
MHKVNLLYSTLIHILHSYFPPRSSLLHSQLHQQTREEKQERLFRRSLGVDLYLPQGSFLCGREIIE